MSSQIVRDDNHPVMGWLRNVRRHLRAKDCHTPERLVVLQYGPYYMYGWWYGPGEPGEQMHGAMLKGEVFTKFDEWPPAEAVALWARPAKNAFKDYKRHQEAAQQRKIAQRDKDRELREDWLKVVKKTKSEKRWMRARARPFTTEGLE